MVQLVHARLAEIVIQWVRVVPRESLHKGLGPLPYIPEQIVETILYQKQSKREESVSASSHPPSHEYTS